MNSNPIDQSAGTTPCDRPALASPMSACRLQLVWCIRQEPDAVLQSRFCFHGSSPGQSSTSGAAEGFVVFEVTPDKATLVGVGEFAEEAMDGNENKLAAKVDFLAAATPSMSWPSAPGHQAADVQGHPADPVNEVDAIDDPLPTSRWLMTEAASLWIDRAMAAQAKAKSEDRFTGMEAGRLGRLMNSRLIEHRGVVQRVEGGKAVVAMETGGCASRPKQRLRRRPMAQATDPPYCSTLPVSAEIKPGDVVAITLPASRLTLSALLGYLFRPSPCSSGPGGAVPWRGATVPRASAPSWVFSAPLVSPVHPITQPDCPVSDAPTLN